MFALPDALYSALFRASGLLQAQKESDEIGKFLFFQARSGQAWRHEALLHVLAAGPNVAIFRRTFIGMTMDRRSDYC